MKKMIFLLMTILSFSVFSVTYFGKNCKRVTRDNMYTRISGRVHANGLLIHENKEKIERPIRDCWVHLSNPMRHIKTQFHFEDNYKAGSAKFNGNYVQFYDEPGIVFDPMRFGHAFNGIIAIGLENQDNSRSAFLQIAGENIELELRPESSCLYYFSASNYEITTFKVRSDAFHGYLYQKLYYNNNVDGSFLKKEYKSPEFESFQNRYIDSNMFHKFYPHYPNLD